MITTELYQHISPMMNFSYMQRKWLDFYLKPIAKRYDLKSMELFLLILLHLNPEVETAKDIEKYSEMKRGNISVLVEGLAKKEMLVQEHLENDRRKRKLVLTEKSAPLMEETDKIINNYVITIIKDIPKENLENCDNTFKKMHENLFNSAKTILTMEENQNENI